MNPLSLPFKFCVLFHRGRHDTGQPISQGTWWDARREAEKEAAKHQLELTDEQLARGYRYSVLVIEPGYKPLWRPSLKKI